jgi:hypothetical protein
MQRCRYLRTPQFASENQDVLKGGGYDKPGKGSNEELVGQSDLLRNGSFWGGGGLSDVPARRICDFNRKKSRHQSGRLAGFGSPEQDLGHPPCTWVCLVQNLHETQLGVLNNGRIQNHSLRVPTWVSRPSYWMTKRLCPQRLHISSRPKKAAHNANS